MIMRGYMIPILSIDEKKFTQQLTVKESKFMRIYMQEATILVIL